MRSRLVRLGVLVLAVAAIAYGVYTYRASHRDPEVRYETTPADRGPIVARVMATGTLSALVTVQVGSQVSGRLKEIFVDFNSEVRRGEVIARIDPQLFQAALEQARANFAAAEGDALASRVQAANARLQANRSRDLADRSLIALADRDTALATAEAAEAQSAATSGRVQQARAALHQAQVNLAYTTITSPIDGIVVSRSVDVGQTVAASLQAPTLFVIAEDLRKMQVDTSVAEADIGKLRSGMEATFRVDAYPARRFRGTVRQVRNAPQTVQNVITYDAVIDVDNGELLLKPGMTANVTFVHDHRDDVLRIPNAALRYRPPTPTGTAARPERPRRRSPDEAPDRRTIWVLRAARPVSVEIRIGLTDGSLTEVVEGNVRSGDRVITDATSGSESGGAARRPGGGGGMGMRRMF